MLPSHRSGKSYKRVFEPSWGATLPDSLGKNIDWWNHRSRSGTPASGPKGRGHGVTSTCVDAATADDSESFDSGNFDENGDLIKSWEQVPMPGSPGNEEPVCPAPPI